MGSEAWLFRFSLAHYRRQDFRAKLFGFQSADLQAIGQICTKSSSIGEISEIDLGYGMVPDTAVAIFHRDLHRRNKLFQNID